MRVRVGWDDRPVVVASAELRGGEVQALAVDAICVKGAAANLSQILAAAPFCVICVLNGRIDIEGEQPTVTGNAGDCLLLPPGSSVSLRASGHPARWFAVSIAPPLRDPVLALHQLNLAFTNPLACAGGTTIAAAMERFAGSVERGSVAGAEAAAALADLIVTVALELGRSDEECARCPGRSAEGRRRLYDRLIASKMLVHGSHGNVSISSLAAAAGLSPWYFVRTFHTVFGVTPYQYALDRRMTYARHLLLETQSSVRDIAIEVGFGNSSAFVRAFGQRFGLAPTRIRRRDGLARPTHG